jgi:phosphatidate cytidylyltransferase
MSISIKRVLSRLLVFFIGLPLVIAVIYFFPQHNHLLADILITLLSGIAAFEMAVIFVAKHIEINKVFAVFLGVAIPAGAALTYGGIVQIDLFRGCLFAGIVLIVLKTLFYPEKQFEKILPIFAAELAVLLYPGLLLSAVIFLGARGDSTAAMIFFLTLVIADDSFAWLFGLLFGKGNRGIVKVSPNKSIAGFAGGLFAAVLLGLVFQRYLPFNRQGAGVFIAFFTALAATIGDLGESALKRSAAIKDSGRLFPGRGGVLDSLDSIALAAPVYYLLYTFFTA